ncbi:hypothetical protein GGR57DRAFT_519161 [Xylariaceae sp. FL1272]|nr:hypothetical protein GGR57DRAFT_519161 [Xylariaceae sp. FL1272]
MEPNSVIKVTSDMKSLILAKRNTPGNESPVLPKENSFLGIPLELRREIYLEVFGYEDVHGTISVIKPAFPNKKGKLPKTQPKKLSVPSIMLVCKQAYFEGVQTYWEHRRVWLNDVTYVDGRVKANRSTALYHLMPRLSKPIAANIRHVRGQNIEKWGEMNKGRARYLLQQLPNLKTFRFHGSAHLWPFWADGCDQYPDIMEWALKGCGGNFRTGNTRDIIASFPMNPNTCTIEFQMVIVVTTIMLDNHDYYELFINLNTGKHKFFAGHEDIDELMLSYTDKENEIFAELRVKDSPAASSSSRS